MGPGIRGLPKGRVTTLLKGGYRKTSAERFLGDGMASGSSRLNVISVSLPLRPAQPDLRDGHHGPLANAASRTVL